MHPFLRSIKFLVNSREAPYKSLQGFTFCFQLLFLSIILLLPEFFQLSFRLIILLLPEFFMEDQHGGSSRIPFILKLSSRFFSKLRSAKLYSKINMVFNTCLVWRSLSFLQFATEAKLFHISSFELVLCHCS